MPGGGWPGTGRAAGSDETGQPPAGTLLSRVFGGESPRLQALLRLRTGELQMTHMKRKKKQSGYNTKSVKKREILSKMGGGAWYGRTHTISLSETQNNNLNPPLSYNGPILPNPHISVKRYPEKRGVFRVFSQSFFSASFLLVQWSADYAD
jgi:hypothetical protein